MHIQKKLSNNVEEKLRIIENDDKQAHSLDLVTLFMSRWISDRNRNQISYCYTMKIAKLYVICKLIWVCI